MPCRDYYDDNPGAYYADTIDGLRKQVSFAESALCQTLVAFNAYACLRQENALDFIKYKDAGINRKQLEKWWAEHTRKDEESKHRAAVKEEKDRVRKQALAKLSPAERKILGV